MGRAVTAPPTEAIVTVGSVGVVARPTPGAIVTVGPSAAVAKPNPEGLVTVPMGVAGAPAYDYPGLVSYNWLALDQGPYAVLGFTNNVTDGDPCRVLFVCYSGRDTIAAGWSSPEQNSPHFVVSAEIWDPERRGRWYNLEWRWQCTTTVPGLGGPYLIGYNEVYIPAEGEGSSQGGG